MLQISSDWRISLSADRRLSSGGYAQSNSYYFLRPIATMAPSGGSSPFAESVGFMTCDALDMLILLLDAPPAAAPRRSIFCSNKCRWRVRAIIT